MTSATSLYFQGSGIYTKRKKLIISRVIGIHFIFGELYEKVNKNQYIFSISRGRRKYIVFYKGTCFIFDSMIPQNPHLQLHMKKIGGSLMAFSPTLQVTLPYLHCKELFFSKNKNGDEAYLNGKLFHFSKRNIKDTFLVNMLTMTDAHRPKRVKVLQHHLQQPRYGSNLSVH